MKVFSGGSKNLRWTFSSFWVEPNKQWYINVNFPKKEWWFDAFGASLHKGQTALSGSESGYSHVLADSSRECFLSTYIMIIVFDYPHNAFDS